MSYFQLYEQERKLKSKLQIDSQWRWKGPHYRHNEITVKRITTNEVYYYYTDTPGLHSSTDIKTFMRGAIPLVPLVKPAH